MNEIRYDNPQDSVNYKLPSIFLAGPTVRGNQTHLTSWRFEAIELFKKHNFEGNLIIPEFVSRTESDKHRYDLPIWENYGLTHSGVIMFWIPRTRELIALCTNFEMGYWMAKERSKVIYGRPDGSFRNEYNDVLWVHDAGDMGECPIYTTLEETVKATLNKIKKNWSYT